MPNHITNRLIIEGATEEVAKVFDFLKADKPNESGVVVFVDFNKLVPMPESLEVESSSEGDDGKKYLRNVRQLSRSSQIQGVRSLQGDDRHAEAEPR